MSYINAFFDTVFRPCSWLLGLLWKNTSWLKQYTTVSVTWNSWSVLLSSSDLFISSPNLNSFVYYCLFSATFTMSLILSHKSEKTFSTHLFVYFFIAQVKVVQNVQCRMTLFVSWIFYFYLQNEVPWLLGGWGGLGWAGAGGWN